MANLTYRVTTILDSDELGIDDTCVRTFHTFDAAEGFAIRAMQSAAHLLDETEARVFTDAQIDAVINGVAVCVAHVDETGFAHMTSDTNAAFYQLLAA